MKKRPRNLLPRATVLSSPSPASICLPLSSGNKNGRFRKLCFFRFSCFSVFSVQALFAYSFLCSVHLALSKWAKKIWALPSRWSWGHDFVWILQVQSVQFRENTVKQKTSEKPPPQSNEAEFCFTFHYFWVGDYPNLHKLVWYSGMTGHGVAFKCSIASCIHWPCSSPAPSVRIASYSKHQPCRFLSLYCCDKNADRPHFLVYVPSIYSCRSRTSTVPS